MSPETYYSHWGLTVQRAKALKPHAIIMHPGPIARNLEIANELVDAPGARIFEQMSNGVYTSIAVLEWAISKIS